MIYHDRRNDCITWSLEWAREGRTQEHVTDKGHERGTSVWGTTQSSIVVQWRGNVVDLLMRKKFMKDWDARGVRGGDVCEGFILNFKTEWWDESVKIENLFGMECGQFKSLMWHTACE